MSIRDGSQPAIKRLRAAGALRDAGLGCADRGAVPPGFTVSAGGSPLASSRCSTWMRLRPMPTRDVFTGGIVQPCAPVAARLAILALVMLVSRHRWSTRPRANLAVKRSQRPANREVVPHRSPRRPAVPQPLRLLRGASLSYSLAAGPMTTLYEGYPVRRAIPIGARGRISRDWKCAEELSWSGSTLKKALEGP